LRFYNCEKKRNLETGSLSGFVVPQDLGGRPTLIIDDICDGGGTFMGIAQEVYALPLGLYVTHGIFSRGFDKLKECFTRIYASDSMGLTFYGDDVQTLDSHSTLWGLS